MVSLSFSVHITGLNSSARGHKTTKFQVDRILRFKVTMRNSDALWTPGHHFFWATGRDWGQKGLFLGDNPKFHHGNISVQHVLAMRFHISENEVLMENGVTVE